MDFLNRRIGYKDLKSCAVYTNWCVVKLEDVGEIRGDGGKIRNRIDDGGHAPDVRRYFRSHPHPHSCGKVSEKFVQIRIQAGLHIYHLFCGGVNFEVIGILKNFDRTVVRHGFGCARC